MTLATKLPKLTKSQSRILKSAAANDAMGGHLIKNLTEMRKVRELEALGLVVHIQPDGFGQTIWGEAKITPSGVDYLRKEAGNG